jgi:hypothetical protein
MARPGRLAQLVRALPLQGRCRGFESLSAHHGKRVKPQVGGHFRSDRTLPLVTVGDRIVPQRVARVWHDLERPLWSIQVARR